MAAVEDAWWSRRRGWILLFQNPAEPGMNFFFLHSSFEIRRNFATNSVALVAMHCPVVDGYRDHVQWLGEERSHSQATTAVTVKTATNKSGLVGQPIIIIKSLYQLALHFGIRWEL